MTTSNASTPSNCPRCGCPPRYIHARAVVRLSINKDGTYKLDKTSGVVSIDENTKTFQCGGGHVWG